jgi:threonine/homoserine/homoserine lactone efflux protein
VDALWTGVIAGYGIAIPVGAIGILIIDTGIRNGFGPAFFAGAGAATADLLYALLAVIGGSAIVGLVGSVEEPLRVASGLVLAVIAGAGLWRSRDIAEAVSHPTISGGRQMARTYARFLALTLINPATVVYFAAVIIGLGVAVGMTPGQGAAFALGAGLASLSWQTLIAAVGAFAGSRLTSRSRKVISIVGYLVILGFAVVVLLG